MFTRLRSLLVAATTLIVLALAPASAQADSGHDIRVDGGYGPDQYAPAGPHYEGQPIELRVKIENAAGIGEPNAGGLGFTITWDDQRSTLSPNQITSDLFEGEQPCENETVEPAGMDLYGYDRMTCAISPVLELAPGESAIVSLFVTPERGSTGTDWARDFNIFFTVTAAGTDIDDGNNQPEAIIEITDLLRADLGVTATGPESVQVPAAGANVTYSSTITNAGPAEVSHAVAYFVLPYEMTYVSGTAGGAAVTCERAEQSSYYAEMGQKLWACPSGALAVGASRAFSITANVTPGVGEGTRKFALPSTLKVQFEAGFSMMDYVANEDPNFANDAVTRTISFSAAIAPTCPTGQIGTPPTCVDPAKTFTGGTKAATYVGGTGDDKFTGGKGNETFRGGAGNDVGMGGLGNDKLFGDAGNDTLAGGVGNDVVDGGVGTDKVKGDAGNDTVTGGAGNDTANGGAGNDKVLCGPGKFTDKLFGDAGNDTLNCKDGAGGDTINGGAGKDTCFGDKKDVFVGCEKIVRS